MGTDGLPVRVASLASLVGPQAMGQAPRRCPVSAILPREERDAIRAMLDEGQQYEMGSLTELFWLRDVVDRVPALLDALDAAEAESPVCRVLAAHESGIRGRERAAFAALLDAEDDEDERTGRRVSRACGKRLRGES
jgi:hypothetical protein